MFAELWRCDRQFDCKDGSDERHCIYPTSSPKPPATTTTITTSTSTTLAPLSRETFADLELHDDSVLINATSSYSAGRDKQQSDEISDNSDGVGEQPPAQLAGVESRPANPQSIPSGLDSRQQLELNLNGDVSRIIQLEQASSLPSVTPSQSDHSAPTSPSGPSSSGPTSEQIQSQTEASRQQTTLANGVQVEIGDLAAQGTPSSSSVQSVKALDNMRKFDYDLIPSQPALANNQLNSNEPVNQQIVEQQQQQQQQRPLEQTAVRAQAGEMLGDQNQRQHGQPIRGLKFANHQQQAEGESMVAPGAQLISQQRVPIYRSIFKSFKSVANQAATGAARGQREILGERRGNVVAIARRRRDRHPSPALVNAAGSNPQNSNQQQQGADVNSIGAINQQQHQQAAGSQRNLVTPVQAQQTSHAVASYLQLLNSRYNLRLPRVAANQLQ